MEEHTPLSTDGGQETPRGELHHDSDPDELEETEDTAPDDPQARLEYLKNIVPPPKPKRKWPAIVLLIVVVLALLAGGGYWYSKHHRSNKSAVRKSTAAQTVQPAANARSSSLAHYVSNGQDLNLDFDYPSNWTVSPPSGDNANDQTITLTSPLTSLANSSGSAGTGKVVVTIRPGSAQLNELNNNVTAAQASVQFAYSKPTSAQHQYPYLTFLHFGSGSSPTFQEVLVTGTLQFVPGTSITSSSVSVDPIIGANFYSCAAQACTGSGAAPLSITNDTWQNTGIFQQTLAIFESMQLN